MFGELFAYDNYFSLRILKVVDAEILILSYLECHLIQLRKTYFRCK